MAGAELILEPLEVLGFMFNLGVSYPSLVTVNPWVFFFPCFLMQEIFSHIYTYANKSHCQKCLLGMSTLWMMTAL